MWQTGVFRAVFFALLAAGVASCVVPTTESGAGHQGAFRITPYVQNPGQREMTLTWFSETANPGQVDLQWTGRNGSSNRRSLGSSPEVASALAYHPLEIERFPEHTRHSLPYRHEVRLAGLAPGTEYDYRVTQDGESAGGRFGTLDDGDRELRFIVYADSETEPESTGKRAAWPGSGPATEGRLYPVDQTTGYLENLALIAGRKPDFIAIAGDLVQSGGEQRDWDEFWRHNQALAASTPILPALGNHEYFGGPGELGKYENPDSERAVAKYRAYFDLPANGKEAHHERYYSKKFGPVTLIVLDGNSGRPHGSKHDTNWRLKNEREGGVAPGWRPGSDQYRWLEKTLAVAQANSRFTFVMFHNCPYSSGVHGQPPGEGTGQDILSGLPLQELTPLFMRYGVDALLTGHDEMYEHSVVPGFEWSPGGKEEEHQLHVFDVGIGGDGLRGPIPGLENPMRVFLAHTDAPEVYSSDGVLLDGGKHYGHLEINIEKSPDGGWRAELDMAYLFPVTGADGEISRFERRLYERTVIFAE